MLKYFILTILNVLVYNYTFAQPGSAVQLSVFTDQHVYITGEEIWISGNLAKADPLAKYIQLQLLDRKGLIRAELRLLNSNGRFSGSMEIPAELISDYYFLDAFIKGISTSVNMQAVMVINPKSPPVACSINDQKAIAEPLAITAGITITTDKEIYSNRAPVSVNSLSLSEAESYSIVVKRADRLSTFADSICDGILLRSVHDAAGDFEKDGNVIHARITSVMEGAPRSGKRIFASVMGDQAKLSSGISDADGRVKLVLPFIYGETQVVFSLEGNNDQRYRIEMEDDSIAHQPVSFPCLQLNETMRADIEERVLSFRSQKGFYGGALKNVQVTDSDTTDFYGKPDHYYALDNYVRFPDMKELLVEFVPEARVRNDAGGLPVIQVLDEPYKSFSDSGALVLLDGIPVQDTKSLLAFDPLKIRSIDIMSRKYYLGDMLFNGIVHYKTYKSDLSGFTLPERDVIYPYSGIQIPAAPAFTSYEKSIGDPIPNFRNLLYAANMSIDAKNIKQAIRFYTSDANGLYKIVIRGSDKNGNSYFGEKLIEIK